MNEIQQEIARIVDLADRLYTDYPTEGDWEQLLVCILRRFPPSYFWQDVHDRKTVQQLLTPDLKQQAVLTWQFVGMSDISDFLKHRVCGSCQTFLHRIGTTDTELDELKKIFDPASINISIFAGLEE